MWPRQEVANRPSRCWGRGRGPQDGRRECQLWGQDRLERPPLPGKGVQSIRARGRLVEVLLWSSSLILSLCELVPWKDIWPGEGCVLCVWWWCVCVLGGLDLTPVSPRPVHTYRKRGESLRHSSKSSLTVISACLVLGLTGRGTRWRCSLPPEGLMRKEEGVLSWGRACGGVPNSFSKGKGCPRRTSHFTLAGGAREGQRRGQAEKP